MEKKLEKANLAVEERAFLEVKLQNIFMMLESLEASCKAAPDLKIVYENKVDPDPRFSRLLSANFILDEEKNLLLISTPFKSDLNLSRKEILFKNVKEYEFEFFSPKDKKNIWKKTWEEKEIPRAIRLKLTLENKEVLHFAIFTPSHSCPIEYLEESL